MKSQSSDYTFYWFSIYVQKRHEGHLKKRPQEKEQEPTMLRVIGHGYTFEWKYSHSKLLIIINYN